MIDTNTPAVASGTNDSYTLPAQTKERPILFSAAMVRAILDGKKTQTRRIVKGVALEWLDDAGFDPHFVAKDNDLCPYGKVGDRLWVRETFCPNYFDEPDFTTAYKADYTNDIADVVQEPKWKPSIHMPRKLSRINLEITDIRVERLQDITDADAQAEGVDGWSGVVIVGNDIAFAELWDKINAKRGYGWDKNPWVWVVTFKRV